MADAILLERLVAERYVKLELTEDEARVLAVVLNNIGGSPEDSPRRHTTAVRDALTEAGVHGFGQPEENLIEQEARAIYFRSYDGSPSVISRDWSPRA